MNGSWNNIARHISEINNKETTIENRTSVSGGCINQCWKVTDNYHKHWFIKTNAPSLLKMFEAEAEGLEEILNSQSIRVPKGFCHGSTHEFSYLVMEYIALSPLTNSIKMGEQLAKMHRFSSDKFGWHRNNTIGSTHQSNNKHKDWISFWKEERLLYQLELALKNGFSHQAYEAGLRLLEILSSFFTSYQVQPSLLHGDLWGGNTASDSEGNPVIFDPAVYYGDRETDLAMTELFGGSGFNNDFYASYNAHYPIDSNYKTRKGLYNLYHILNHFNLFGGGYASQASQIISKLISDHKN